MKKTGPVLVLGDGAWGTALALVLHRKKVPVRVWGAFPDYVREVRRTGKNDRFLPGVRIPRGIGWTGDLAEGADGARAVVMAVPTQFARSVLVRYRPHHPRGAPVISVAKGLELKTHLRNTQVIRACLGRVTTAVLSGPSHAEEVARGLPASVVAAARDAALAARIQRLFSDEGFRVYRSTDPTGVELGGALKNVVALAAGICDGLGLGDNAKAAVLTRGLAEIARLGRRMGARRATFYGLSCLGDLITTCASPHGRNLRVGRALGEGKKLDVILAGSPQVAEGVPTAKAVVEFARRKGVEMPLATEVFRICRRGKDPRRAFADLMRRNLKAE